MNVQTRPWLLNINFSIIQIGISCQYLPDVVNKTQQMQTKGFWKYLASCKITSYFLGDSYSLQAIIGSNAIDLFWLLLWSFIVMSAIGDVCQYHNLHFIKSFVVLFYPKWKTPYVKYDINDFYWTNNQTFPWMSRNRNRNIGRWSRQGWVENTRNWNFQTASCFYGLDLKLTKLRYIFCLANQY